MLAPAGWYHGDIELGDGAQLTGAMQRLGVVARYALATYVGGWERSEQWNVPLYVEAAVGEERISLDRLGSFYRPDYAIGAGVQPGVRLRGHGLFGSAYSLRLFWSPAANTPEPLQIPAPRPYPASGGRDLGWMMTLTVLFGG